MIRKKFFNYFFIIMFFLFFSTLTNANSGCWQFVHNSDLRVLLSSSPISPFENEKTSMVFSFVNGTEFLNDLNVVLKISRGDFFEEENFRAEKGILELKKKFLERGVYEIVVEFESGDNGKKYEVDFLFEVKEKRKNFYGALMLVIGILAGVLIGLKWKRK